MKKRTVLVIGLIVIACVILLSFLLSSIDMKAIVQQIGEDPLETSNYSGILWMAGSFIIVLAITANIACLPFLIKEMAKNDFMFTFIDEGTAKAIMGAGDSGFQRLIYQFKDFTLNKEWDVEPKTSADDEKGFLHKAINLFGLSGIKILGLPGMHSLHNYTFRWNSLKQSPDDKTIDAGGIYYTPHEKKINYILLQSDVYYARVEQAEDRSMVPLDLDITIEVKIVNPYKAMFARQEWLEMTWSVVLPSLRRFTSTQKWEDLSRRTKEKEAEYITSVHEPFELLKKEVGVEIVKFYIIRIRPSGTRAEMYEAAATKEFEARKEAKRIGILARAEQGRIKKVYGEIKEFDELGQMIRRLEALEKAAQGNGNTIISAPELGGIASAVKAISKVMK